MEDSLCLQHLSVLGLVLPIASMQSYTSTQTTAEEMIRKKHKIHGHTFEAQCLSACWHTSLISLPDILKHNMQSMVIHSQAIISIKHNLNLLTKKKIICRSEKLMLALFNKLQHFIHRECTKLHNKLKLDIQLTSTSWTITSPANAIITRNTEAYIIMVLSQEIFKIMQLWRA